MAERPHCPNCPNCGAVADARYCPACGQRQSGRLTVRDLIHEFFARFLSAERGLPLTLIELTTRPGQTARNYLAGKRRRYLSPLVWYVLCSGSTVLSTWLARDMVTGAVVDSLPEPYFEFLADNGIDEPKEWVRSRYMLLIQSAYSWLGLFTFVLPMALVMRLCMWGRANFAETAVVSLFSISHVMGITSLTMHGMLRISPQAHGFLSIGIYIVYAILTVGFCFRWSLQTVLAGVLSILVSSACFFMTLALLTNELLTRGLG